MKPFTIALLFWASLCWGQKPVWTPQELKFMKLGSDLRAALDAIDENSKPRQASESVLEEGTCGQLLVYTPGAKDSKGNEIATNVRTTFDGQRPGKIAFCWLDEVRRRFAAMEIEAKDDPRTDAFVKDVKLSFLTGPDSVYLRLVNVYCSNGGTFYTSLAGTVLECPKATGKQ